jgi:hypothetical protein
MNDSPNPIDEPSQPEDPPPASDPAPEPNFPKTARKHDARPETLANNTQVTPLDPDKNAEDGIEVNET